MIIQSLYSKTLLKHFRNPQNMGIIKNADSWAQVGNPVCGDVMRIYLKIEKNKIRDIKFQTLGCAAAIAISSLTTQLAKGRTLNQALKIKSIDIIKALGGVPAEKIHCSLLAVQALKKAIEKYKKKERLSNPNKNR